jgi:hypothetical protein
VNDAANAPIITVGDLPAQVIRTLLGRFGLDVEFADDDRPITGSFWGSPEAGIVDRTVHVRGDTPVHSLLHEAAHLVCMDEPRRAGLDTDAGGDDLEEAAVCYLQVVLADYLPGVGGERIMDDMDTWGYSFRLGSTRRWFADDAGDARAWLEENGILTADGRPTFRLRR